MEVIMKTLQLVLTGLLLASQAFVGLSAAAGPVRAGADALHARAARRVAGALDRAAVETKLRNDKTHPSTRKAVMAIVDRLLAGGDLETDKTTSVAARNFMRDYLQALEQLDIRPADVVPVAPVVAAHVNLVLATGQAEVRIVETSPVVVPTAHVMTDTSAATSTTIPAYLSGNGRREKIDKDMRYNNAYAGLKIRELKTRAATQRRTTILKATFGLVVVGAATYITYAYSGEIMQVIGQVTGMVRDVLTMPAKLSRLEASVAELTTKFASAARSSCPMPMPSIAPSAAVEAVVENCADVAKRTLLSECSAPTGFKKAFVNTVGQAFYSAKDFTGPCADVVAETMESKCRTGFGITRDVTKALNWAFSWVPGIKQ